MENATEKKKRKNGIETRERLLDAAAELFARQGFDGVSVYAIASAAGIRESSVYNHFASKADILEALFEQFIAQTPSLRPSDAEIDQMLLIMQPQEVFKAILFHFGSRVSDRMYNIAMVINNEKYKNPRAVEMYYRHVVAEPSDYYERLIRKMVQRGMVGAVDARMFAEQYNYVSIALTKEYFLAKNGLADERAVVGYMVKTIGFFCDLMKSV
ncbi:MAG: TetR/AcrR family transcriptional regulator [Bacillota bacterium]